jgi:hypothetical protein
MDVDDYPMTQENKGEKRKQPPCRDPPHVKIPSRNLGEKSYAAAIEFGRKELCQSHSSFAIFNEYQKLTSSDVRFYAIMLRIIGRIFVRRVG